MGEFWEDFGGYLAGEFRGGTGDVLTIRQGAGANSGGGNGPVFYGGGTKTNGGYAQRARSPGLCEMTTGPQSSQGHGGEMFRFGDRASARINRSRGRFPTLVTLRHHAQWAWYRITILRTNA